MSRDKIASTHEGGDDMNSKPKEPRPETVVARLALNVNDVRGGMLESVSDGFNAGWVDSLSTRQLRQIAEDAGAHLRSNGSLTTALTLVGEAQFKNEMKTDCRKAAGRMNPRYARAFENFSTVILEDGTTGYQTEVVWPVHGKTRYLVSDQYMRSLAAPAAQDEWTKIRDEAIARHRAMK
jgi:hypothetical protein